MGCAGCWPQPVAGQGKTVFVSDDQRDRDTVMHLVVIGKGRLIADTSVAEFTAGHASLEDAFVDLTNVEYCVTSEEEKCRTPGDPDPGDELEWTKLRTQPGALWSLLSAVVLVVAFGILYSLLRVARPQRGDGRDRSTQPRSAWPGCSSRRSRPGCSACY